MSFENVPGGYQALGDQQRQEAKPMTNFRPGEKRRAFWPMSQRTRFVLIIIGVTLGVGIGIFSVVGAITILVFYLMLVAVYLFIASSNE